MTKHLIRRALWLLVMAAAALAARRMVTARSQPGQSVNSAAPVIGGDTWPPVPVNPHEKG